MEITATTADAYRLFHEGALAFGRAERRGMRIDVDYCEHEQAHLIRKATRLEDQLLKTKFVKHWQKYVGTKFNMNSDTQLSNFLYKEMGLKPPKRTTKGAGAADNEALLELDIPELNKLIEIRKLLKMKDYLKGYYREQTNGVIHPFFNLNLARSFRSSSSNPNFQNVPKRDADAMKICRRAFFPRVGHQFLEADYAGIEVRVSACYHKDPNMLAYINDPKSDMHGDMAKQIFMLDKLDRKLPSHKKLRDAAKGGFVFSQFYGDYYVNCAVNMACGWGDLSKKGKWKPNQGVDMPEGKLSDHLISKGIKSLAEFTEHVKQIEDDFWNKRFRIYQQWKDDFWEEYQSKGYLDMFTGFRASGVMSKNQVINTPVQGAAFHCLLWSFIEIDKVAMEEEWDTGLVGQIHDAFVLDTNPEERDYVGKTIQRISCEDLPKAWPWIITPMEVDADIGEVDGPWSEKKSFDLTA